MTKRDTWLSPLSTRYATAAMRANFSDDTKFKTWRRLWIELARAERELGLDISAEQLAELEEHAEAIDYEAAGRYERELRHDVMAHVHAFGDQCPGARGIIHLGATSCFVTDNTELIQLRAGLRLIRGQLVGVIGALADFARRHADVPTLGFTHYQPAQATTVGKRACLWLQDLVHDLRGPRARRGHGALPRASRVPPAPRPRSSSCSTATAPRWPSSIAA